MSPTFGRAADRQWLREGQRLPRQGSDKSGYRLLTFGGLINAGILVFYSFLPFGFLIWLAGSLGRFG